MSFSPPQLAPMFMDTDHTRPLRTPLHARLPPSMTLLAEQNTHHLHLAMMKLMKLLTLALLCGAGAAINTLRAGGSMGVGANCVKEKDAFTVRS